jgi:hypothetical protein
MRGVHSDRSLSYATCDRRLLSHITPGPEPPAPDIFLCWTCIALPSFIPSLLEVVASEASFLRRL